MEEFQEADILWPESTQNHKSFINWQNYLHYTPSQSGAIASTLSSTSSSSNSSTCTQDELHESDFSWPGGGAEDIDDSYFFAIANLSEEKICCDEEWQEADVLWPDQESLSKYRGLKFAWENCSVGDERHLMTKGESRNISSPIDIIVKSKINYFGHLL